MAFEISVFPGEGPHTVGAPQGEMILCRAPSRTARVERTIRLEGAVQWVDTRLRTVAPGQCLAIKSGSIRGTSYGQVSFLSNKDYYSGGGRGEIFHFGKGDTIEYLQYRAEGSGFVRINGAVVSPEFVDLPFKESKKPELQLWINIAGSDGEPIGWYEFPSDSGCLSLGMRSFCFENGR